MKIKPFSLALCCLLFFSVIISRPVQANNPAGWINQRTEIVSPEDAKVNLEQRGVELESERQQQALTSDQVFSTTEAQSSVSTVFQTNYEQIAQALENDPLKIYLYVRNHFKYEPYFGALKGPYLTLLERSGNDFDQAALLIELLRAAGYTAI